MNLASVKKLSFLAIFSFFSLQLFADTAFDSIRTSLSNIIDIGNYTKSTFPNYEYDGNGALKGGWIKPGSSLALRSTYTGGNSYLIMATSNNPNLDIDLKLYQGDSNGTLITKDTDTNGFPIIVFVPGSTGNYTYVVENVSSQYAFVSVLCMKQNTGVKTSYNSLIEALNNIINLSEMSFSGLNMLEDQWILFGGYVSQGSAYPASLFNVRLPQGAYTLIGVGDSSVYDCDVKITQQTGVNVTSGPSAEDSRATPVAFVLFNATGNHYYKYDVINYSSRNASAFVFGILFRR